jgi:hypothetical protein
MSRKETVYYTVRGTKLRETEKAIHFDITEVAGEAFDCPVTHWFPISQLKSTFIDPKSTGNDTLEVADWILESKGLI